jgi:phosphomannomutase
MNKEILDKVFKAYDIRGKCSDGLDEKLYYELGKAYVTRFRPKTVVIGHDIRPESFTFKQALQEAILDSGCNVVDIGEIPTEMIYFAAGEYYQVYDGGLVVTASHNPQGWNGCKIVTKNAKPVGKDTGLEDMKQIILDQKYKKVSKSKGTFADSYLYPAFRDKVLSFITTKKRKPLNLVVDPGNGIGGKLFDYLFEPLGLNISRMYFVPNGLFPNHVPDPLKEENVTDLKQRVINEDADFGIAIDADADRVFFIDKKGRNPDGVYTGILLARNILKRSDNKRIIHDPRVTWPFEKEGAKFDAKTIQSIAGHSYFKHAMETEDAVFGAEQSSHFYYRDFYNCDSGMVTIAHLLNMYFEGFELTKAVDYLFETYPNSGEVNYKVNDADEVLKKLEKHYKNKGAKIAKLDGVSAEFNDWRFNLRKSNTQPLIRLNLEATDKNTVINKFHEVEKLIGFPRDNVPTLAELR